MKKRFAVCGDVWKRMAVIGWLVFTGLPTAQANPQGGVVTQGSAKFSSSGSQLTIRTSNRAFINWNSFNIGAGESTRFIQPSASSIVWNRINDPNPSQLLGRLDANGYVILQNTAGFYVGGQASLNAAGLVLTTSPTPPPDLLGGGAFDFNSVPPTASIVNYGEMNVGRDGSLFLIARDIENHGSLTAPGGNIGLYAGKDVLVSERSDGKGLSAQVNLPQGSVDNEGKLIADAGTIALNAQVVNQGGLIQANSAREVNGKIELVASDSLTLGASSVISAKGDNQWLSGGGTVTIKSGNAFSDAAGSIISVAGGAAGGNGGQVEISATAMDTIQSTVDGTAASGWQGGRLMIDPQNITIGSTGLSAPGSGSVPVGTPGTTLTYNASSFTGMYQIDLQASQNITIATGWTLADSIGQAATLTLEAGNNITVNQGAFIKAGQNWTVDLYAGVTTFSKNGQGPIVKSGVGSVLVNSGSQPSTYGIVQAVNGNINVDAGLNVTVGNGAIKTIGGGSVNVTAEAGNVNAGASSTANLFGYVIGSRSLSVPAPGYTVSPNLDGISTAAGGDVNITAGGDVKVALPQGSVAATSTSSVDWGSGAFGPEPGVVTVNAGGNVSGHFVAANSQRNGRIVASTIKAGGDAGISTSALALSLVKGGWEVDAPNGGIFLQEVRDPNGVFNTSLSSLKHQFDYGRQSFVTLNANTVELSGTSLPGILNDDAGARVAVYPPTLNIKADSGGIKIDSAITLYPSRYGELNLTTTDGGSLIGTGNVSTPDLLMSDIAPASFGSTTWQSEDHASAPVQFDNPNPVVLNISGNMENFSLFTPKATHITVHGDMNNSYFTAQNLHTSDVTFLHVGGRIFDQNQETFVLLKAPLSDQVAQEINTVGFLNRLVDANDNPIFGTASPPQFFYSAGTLELSTTGPMSASQYDEFFNLDANGNPISLKPLYLEVQANGQPVPDPKNANKNEVDTQHPVTFLDLATLTALYQGSQSVPQIGTLSFSQEPALKVGGPGKFSITADSVDLGSSGGIQSRGVADNFSLVPLTRSGSDIDINVAHDFTMFSSTVVSYFGGNIDINAGGSVNVGSSAGLGLNNNSAGIYTVGPGNININARDTIDVAGSRVATFDGGKITLFSARGDVRAGNGAQTDLDLQTFQVDPISGQIISLETVFNGSGILTYTLPAVLSGGVTVQPGGTIKLDPGQPVSITPAGDVVVPTGGTVSFTVDTACTITYTAGDGTSKSLDVPDQGGGTLTLPPGGKISFPQSAGSIATVTLPTVGTVFLPGGGTEAVTLHESTTAQPGDITITTPRGSIISGEGGIVQEPLNGNESSGPTITLTAGTHDGPNIIYPGDIDLSGSGVIGGTVILDASRNVSGLVIGRQDTTVNAVQNVSGTFLSGGTANLSAGGTISGTVIGISGINVGAGTVSASLLSVNVSGAGPGAGLSTTATASTAAQSATQEATTEAKTQTQTDVAQNDDDKKKKGKRPLLAKSTGRVTVILPN